LNAVCQPISLLIINDGSGRTFRTQPNRGWLAVVSIVVLGFASVPSVPRFNSRVVISETGGGYRRYSQLVKIYYKCIDLESPLLNVGTDKQL